MKHREELTAMRRALAVVAVTIGLAVSSVCAAQETVIHTYKGDSGSDGSSPSSGLVFDANGNLFGTTSAGGVGEFADGTVFKMSPDSNGGFKFQTIHQFSQATGDGANPGSSVVFDASGNLYGTTPDGGNGCGIVYELSPPATAGGAWAETILHKFDSNGNDGCSPSGRLIFDQAGDLYGGTYVGGGGVTKILFCSNGCGTTYKLRLADGKWTESVLHRFTGEGTDGVNPSGSLAFDVAGNLWGATAVGGAGDSSTCGDPNGGTGIFFCGTVFELSPNADGSWTESTLYSFKNGGSALDGTVFQIHDLRRTVGSWLAQNGQSLHVIGDVLNHRDPKTTAGYAYFQTKQRRDALTDHGSRVLALTPAHMRKPAAPTSVSAATLLPAAESAPIMATENSLAHYRHYFRRADLYQLVWTSPVSEVAARLGVSDVGLAKLCRRAAIPLPGRGYWQRTEAGQPLRPPPLAPAPDGLPELLRIRGTKPSIRSRTNDGATGCTVTFIVITASTAS